MGSVASAAKYLVTVHTTEQKQSSSTAHYILQGIVDALQSISSLQGKHMQKLVDTKLLPPDVAHNKPGAYMTCWANMENTPRKVQKAITKVTFDAMEEWFVQSSAGLDRVRLASASGRAAGCALNAVPVEPFLEINDDAFSTLVALRMGTLDPVPPDVPSVCPCGGHYADLSQYPDHPLVCALLTPRRTWHLRSISIGASPNSLSILVACGGRATS